VTITDGGYGKEFHVLMHKKNRRQNGKKNNKRKRSVDAKKLLLDHV
jgi:hypothetical protein